MSVKIKEQENTTMKHFFQYYFLMFSALIQCTMDRVLFCALEVESKQSASKRITTDCCQATT